jgi:replicative DNA helicase
MWAWGEELVDEAEPLIFAHRGGDLWAKQRLLEHALAEEIKRLEQAARDNRDIPSLLTGINDLERLLGGLQAGRLYVVAVDSSVARSLLSLQLPPTPRSASASGSLRSRWVFKPMALWRP